MVKVIGWLHERFRGTFIWLISSLPIVACTIAVWCWPGLSIPPLDGNSPHALYLLSAIAQSLAAILALVFTIALLVAQFSSNYSYRMFAEPFDHFTLGYLVLFILATVLPLWSMADPDQLKVKLSLNLAVCVLFLLIPYVHFSRTRLSQDKVIERLGIYIRKHLPTRQGREAEWVRILLDVYTNACRLKDYETARKGMNTLTGLVVYAHENANQSAGESMFRSLLDASVGILKDDPRFSLEISQAFTGLAKTALGRRLDSLADEASAWLWEIGERAVEGKLGALAERVILDLGGIALAATRIKTYPTTERAINAVRVLGLRALDQNADDCALWAIRSLGQIGLVAMSVGNPVALRLVADSLGKLGSKTVENRLVKTLKETTSTLGEVLAFQAIQKGLPEELEMVRASLGFIRHRAIKGKFDEGERIAEQALMALDMDERMPEAQDSSIG